MSRERGAGTLLVAVLAVFVLGLAVAFAQFAAVRHAGVRLQGSADLAAVAGAQAQRSNGDACQAARDSAEANSGRVTRCELVGDEVEYVVTVALEAPMSLWPVGNVGTLRAHANAGVVREPATEAAR